MEGAVVSTKTHRDLEYQLERRIIDAVRGVGGDAQIEEVERNIKAEQKRRPAIFAGHETLARKRTAEPNGELRSNLPPDKRVDERFCASAMGWRRTVQKPNGRIDIRRLYHGTERGFFDPEAVDPCGHIVRLR